MTAFITGCKRWIPTTDNGVLDPVAVMLRCEERPEELKNAPKIAKAVTVCVGCPCASQEAYQESDERPKVAPFVEPEVPEEPEEVPPWERGRSWIKPRARPAPLSEPAVPPPVEGFEVGEAPSVRQLVSNTGPSVLGASTIHPFRECMRKGFYSKIRCLRRKERNGAPRKKIDNLDLGILVHTLLQYFYEGREEQGRALLTRVEEFYPELGAEAQRLYEQHQDHWKEHDALVWDVRFAELETRLYFRKKRVKSAKKNLSLCISSRHDLGVRIIRPGEERLPPGEPAPEGVWIIDHKTTQQVNWAHTMAFKHDPQGLQNCATFQGGNVVLPGGVLGAPAAVLYGPLNGFGPNVIGKAVQHDPDKHLKRPGPWPIPPPVLEEFVDDVRLWLYDELADRLFHSECNDDRIWPKSYLCRDPRSGLPCPYISLCEAGGLSAMDYEAEYDVDGQFALTAEKILKAEVATKKRKKKTQGVGEVAVK